LGSTRLGGQAAGAVGIGDGACDAAGVAVAGPFGLGVGAGEAVAVGVTFGCGAAVVAGVPLGAGVAVSETGAAGVCTPVPEQPATSAAVPRIQNGICARFMRRAYRATLRRRSREYPTFFCRGDAPRELGQVQVLGGSVLVLGFPLVKPVADDWNANVLALPRLVAVDDGRHEPHRDEEREHHGRRPTDDPKMRE